jgi:hypothetical protein
MLHRKCHKTLPRAFARMTSTSCHGQRCVVRETAADRQHQIQHAGRPVKHRYTLIQIVWFQYWAMPSARRRRSVRWARGAEVGDAATRRARCGYGVSQVRGSAAWRANACPSPSRSTQRSGCAGAMSSHPARYHQTHGTAGSLVGHHPPRRHHSMLRIRHCGEALGRTDDKEGAFRDVVLPWPRPPGCRRVRSVELYATAGRYRSGWLECQIEGQPPVRSRAAMG